MRTLQEIQEEEAKKRGFRDLEDIRYDMDYEYLTSCMKEAQKEAIKHYHKEVQSLNYCTSFNPLIREELLKIENQ